MDQSRDVYTFLLEKKRNGCWLSAGATDCNSSYFIAFVLFYVCLIANQQQEHSGYEHTLSI